LNSDDPQTTSTSDLVIQGEKDSVLAAESRLKDNLEHLVRYFFIL
jgi:hypothetical protein